ncbi:hypothetical protein DASC09_034270 [Saccharomycopsis crataegensis]|uniref:Uncharacterized protein n=1 Tax=Saccharomycopsis crataegensis TaxID=43959 RepID=A0AAV5QMS2_9ASCO|nr:hypothetical protein DASC09_034270 [Saccharomycopsis crataegensis]
MYFGQFYACVHSARAIHKTELAICGPKNLRRRLENLWKAVKKSRESTLFNSKILQAFTMVLIKIFQSVLELIDTDCFFRYQWFCRFLGDSKID